MPGRVCEVDWERWQPQQRATILFVIRAGRVLLIDKKRGLGAGKVNGPGGRLDPGESPLAGAVRETREELRVTPLGVRPCGELRFQFVDGLAIHGFVFTAEDCDGVPQETAEARPFWVAEHAIPFERMWADDRLWFPPMLAGRRFEGRFLFDGDALLGWELDVFGQEDPGERPRKRAQRARSEPQASEAGSPGLCPGGDRKARA